MEKIKVGYLPFYIKLYDDSDPSGRDPMVEHMYKMIAMLEAEGLEIILADEVCRIREEFDRAVDKFNRLGVTAVITQHLAYSPSLESIDALLRLKADIIVLDTTVDYNLLTDGSKINAMPNHGIHGVQDMCCMLKRNGRNYYLCAGHIQQGKLIGELVGLCRAAAAAKAFREARVGSVGGSFTGMGDFMISDQDYAEKIGANVIYMQPEEIKSLLAQITDAEIDEEIAANQQRYTVEVSHIDNYREASRSGLALRKWVEANKLTACTVNFLTLDEYALPKMPFVECSKLMERGLGYAGEGDVLTAGLVGALMQVYPSTGFTEMFCPDWERDLLLLSHMGESNPNLAAWKPLVTDCSFNYNRCGDTVAMYTFMKAGKAVIVNLVPTDGRYQLLLCPVELPESALNPNVGRKSNQGWFKSSMPLADFLKAYSLAGGTHHCAIVYDVDITELEAFGKMMNFDVTVIG